ncbi:MAG: hypothetical protein M5F18_02905 [Asgard group archaeon]|nr:hypothetical protein JTP64_001480 [Candida tropicalis]MCP8718230.1 hypothetical protein [Asgard group archaeon]
MNLIYILVILVVVTAEVPKIYSEFVTEDSCGEESDYYEKPAKGFSIKELLFWFKKFHKHDDSSDCEYSVDPSDCENEMMPSDEEACSSGGNPYVH